MLQALAPISNRAHYLHTVANHRFRFGLSLLGFDHGHDWQQTARKIEALGFATLLVPDHFGDQLAPFPALMSAAAATESLRVGTYMCAVDFRHPVMLAKEAATIDLLSGGRFELGIGAGWKKSEFEEVGLAFESGLTRCERLEEAITTVRALWSGNPVSFSGKHYRIENLSGRPLPYRGNPPILIGGAGPAMLNLAGRVADIVSIAPRTQAQGTRDDSDITEDSLMSKLTIVREAAGERFANIELSALVLAVRVTDDRDQAATELAARYGLSAAEVISSPHLLVGSHSQIIEALIERRERLGLSYVTIAEPAMETMASVVAHLAGT